MKSTKMIVMLAMGGLLALTPALLAADTNTPPASTPPAGGPPGGGRGARVGPTIEQLTTNLSLTADQVPKVKAVIDDQRQKMTDLRGDTSLSQEDRMAKMQAIRTEVLAKMKEILTPDQFDKYQKMRPMGGSRRTGGVGGAPPAGAPPQN